MGLGPRNTTDMAPSASVSQSSRTQGETWPDAQGPQKGCCTATLLAVTYGAAQDPLVRARREQIREYIKLLEHLDQGEQHLVRKKVLQDLW